MKAKLIQFILEHRFPVLIAIIGLTLIFGWFAASVQFDNTIETYFMESDLNQYNRFLDEFGTDEIIAISFEGENIFMGKELRLIDSISTALEQMPHVRRVLSLTSTRTVYNDNGMVQFTRLINDPPSAGDEKAKIAKRSFEDPFIPGTLISADGKKTAIIAEIDHIIGEFDYKVELLRMIHSYVQKLEQSSGKKFFIGGTSVLDDALFRYNERDQRVYIPLMMLLIIAIVYLMFRRIQYTLLPLTVVILSVIWTYGLLGMLGYKINIISSIIPVLLMGVAIADSMHLIGDYVYEAATSRRRKEEAIQQAFVNILTPCFMTSLTTVLGLLSLLSADLLPIREFGLAAAGGVFFAFLITTFLLPILMNWMSYPKETYRQQFREGFYSKLLFSLGKWKQGRAVLILAISIILAIPAGYLLCQLQVGTNSMDYFRKDDIVRRQVEWIDTNIGGTASLEFLIEGREDDALKDPQLLRKMEAFQNYLKKLDGITGAYSMADMVKALNRGFNNGDSSYFIIPNSKVAVAQELLIVEGSDDLQELVSDDYAKGRITARVEMNKSQYLAHAMPQIRAKMQQIFGNSASVIPTGIVYLMHQMEGYLLNSQIKSLLLAFVIVFLAIFILLRSLRLGLMAIIPNIFPILFTMALMPLFDIHLDVGTVMIGAVALGLVVDDTIHFLSRLKYEIKIADQSRAAIAAAMNATGRPIIFTSLVLSLGFLVLVFASFNPIVNFGLLLFFLILLALLFDLVVLPALLGFSLKESPANDEITQSR